MFKKSQKIILCITSQSLTAGVWHGTKLQSYKVFKNEDEGHTAFSVYMAERQNIDVYLIADAVEEDYKLEALPHTSGSARREIVARKLSQFNRNTEYRTAHYINRDADKRKDDNFLFVALNNADFMQHWMDVIQAGDIPLVGVYLLPMISQAVVRKMKLMAPHILFCERLSSGLRQTYLRNGRLRMSRLTPINNVPDEKLTYFYLTEIEKTRLYLQSQRLISGEVGLQMLLPVDNQQSESIAKSISEEHGVECKTIDIMAFAKNSNLNPELIKKQPALLHMQLLANGNIPDNLAPVSLTKTHNIKNLCRNVHFVSALVTIAGILFSAFYFVQGFKKDSQIDEARVQAERQLKKYELVAQNFPETPIPGNDLKAAVEIANSINPQTPRQIMVVLSAALEGTPEVAISRIRWLQSNQMEITDEESLEDAAISAMAASQELLQVGFINAEIRRFKGDYRAALASASQFANNLRADPLVQQVQILQEPVNVSSLASLEGSTKDESTAQQTPAIFKLKVVLKPIPKEVQP